MGRRSKRIKKHIKYDGIMVSGGKGEKQNEFERDFKINVCE